MLLSADAAKMLPWLPAETTATDAISTMMSDGEKEKGNFDLLICTVRPGTNAQIFMQIHRLTKMKFMLKYLQVNTM